MPEMRWSRQELSHQILRELEEIIKELIVFLVQGTTIKINILEKTQKLCP
jgi:hypothetical protein